MYGKARTLIHVCVIIFPHQRVNRRFWRCWTTSEENDKERRSLNAGLMSLIRSNSYSHSPFRPYLMLTNLGLSKTSGILFELSSLLVSFLIFVLFVPSGFPSLTGVMCVKASTAAACQHICQQLHISSVCGALRQPPTTASHHPATATR